MYGHGGKVTKTDPRPISEKEFRTDCIRSLISYLTSHGYNTQLSAIILSSPSAKEFANILQFLYRKVDPAFTIEKLDEDVPNVFKSLRYPFTISKSALASVGTPHTWPSLLAALTWMVNLLQFDEKSEDPSQGGSLAGVFGDMDETNESTTKKMMLDYAARAYGLYMEGKDDFTDMESDLTTEFGRTSKCQDLY
jgi:kinetochore protein NDC80